MRSTSFGGLLVVALMAAPLSHGTAAAPRYVTCDEIAKGAAVEQSADGAQESKADLLVMGAYGQGRMMQLLGLGGATAKVITANTMPVLLAH